MRIVRLLTILSLMSIPVAAAAPSDADLAAAGWWMQLAREQAELLRRDSERAAAKTSIALAAVDLGQVDLAIDLLTHDGLGRRQKQAVIDKIIAWMDAQNEPVLLKALAKQLPSEARRAAAASVGRVLAGQGKAQEAYDAVPVEYRDVAMLVTLAEAAASSDHPDAALQLAEFADAAHARQIQLGRFDSSACRAYLSAAVAVSRQEGREKDAAAWFALAIKAIDVLPEPMRQAPRLWAADALAEADRDEQAMAMAAQIEDADLQSRALQMIAAHQWQRGEKEAAAQTTRRIEADEPLAWALIDEARHYAAADDKQAAKTALDRAATVLGRIDGPSVGPWHPGALWAAIVEVEADMGQAAAAVARIQSIKRAHRIWALLTEMMNRRAMAGDVAFVRAAAQLVKQEEQMAWRARVIMTSELAAGHLASVEASLADVADRNERCLYLTRLARAYASRRSQDDVRRMVNLISLTLPAVTNDYVGREALVELTWLQVWLGEGRKVHESILKVPDTALRVDLALTAAAGANQRQLDQHPDS